MAATLSADVVQDDIAVSLARAIASASLLWRVNYGPKDYVGRRGGDLIIEVDPSDASIKQALWGQ